MVQFADPGRLRPESEVPIGSKGGAAGVAVKVEVEDPLEEEHGPEGKRFRFSGPFQEWNDDAVVPLPQHKPLCESSPLGLRLRKSPSLLDLIQMRLSQGNSSKTCLSNGDSPEVGKKKDDTKPTSGAPDKLKASNFPTARLRIGTWECVSRYEGDLVAKCYFAKRKLVWEVLDGGLKSKIEIQWADITAIKATCPDNGPSTLDIVLSKQPLFFREQNPQPRKHTLWQATSDFTGGQASTRRMHLLQVPQGLLSKHFEKLIQCDPRLSALSRQPNIVLDSPYFESKCSGLDDQDEAKCLGLDHIKGEYGSPFSGLHDAASPSAVPPSSKCETRDVVRTPDLLSQGNPSPSSVMDSRVIEENTDCDIGDLKEPNKWDQFKVPGIHPSTSLSNFVSHIEQCISEQMALAIERDTHANENMLEDIDQYLLSDSQTFAASDEKSLMSRVSSLYNLLLKDPATNQNVQMHGDGHGEEDDVAPSDEESLMSRVSSLYNLLQKDTAAKHNLQMSTDDHGEKDDADDDAEDEPDSAPCSPVQEKPLFDLGTEDGESFDAFTCKQQAPIPRKESVGDLLMYLPRIASMPHVPYNNIPDDAENKAR